MRLPLFIFGLVTALAVAAPAGPTVRSIEVHFAGAQTVSEERVIANMRTRIGEPFSEQAVEEDVRHLPEIGALSGVRIFGEPEADGVRIIVVVQPRIDHVKADRDQTTGTAMITFLAEERGNTIGTSVHFESGPGSADPARFSPEAIPLELAIPTQGGLPWVLSGDGHAVPFSIRLAPVEWPRIRIVGGPLVLKFSHFPWPRPVSAPSPYPGQNQVLTDTAQLTQTGPRSLIGEPTQIRNVPGSLGPVAGLRVLMLGIFAPMAACLLSALACGWLGCASGAARHLIWMLAFVIMAVCVPITLLQIKVAVPILPPPPPPRPLPPDLSR